MKKIIKVILTTCMLLTCFTMNIMAEGPEDLVIESDDTFVGGYRECKNFVVSSGITLTLEKM